MRIAKAPTRNIQLLLLNTEALLSCAASLISVPLLRVGVPGVDPEALGRQRLNCLVPAKDPIEAWLDFYNLIGTVNN